MIINRLIAKNWRNFQEINVALRERQFIVGPNASGKTSILKTTISNLLLSQQFGYGYYDSNNDLKIVGETRDTLHFNPLTRGTSCQDNKVYRHPHIHTLAKS